MAHIAAKEKTKERILGAAMEVFAERGFRAATTRSICQRAGVNLALVNYYFHSKYELYQEVVFSLFQTCRPPLQPVEEIHDETSWKAAIRNWVSQSLMIAAAEKPPYSYFSRLLGRESSVPSEMFQIFEDRLIRPGREYLMRLLEMGMEKPDPVRIQLAFSLLYSQCMIYALVKPGWLQMNCPPGMDAETWLAQVSDTICETLFLRFSYVDRSACS